MGGGLRGPKVLSVVLELAAGIARHRNSNRIRKSRVAGLSRSELLE